MSDNKRLLLAGILSAALFLLWTVLFPAKRTPATVVHAPRPPTASTPASTAVPATPTPSLASGPAAVSAADLREIPAVGATPSGATAATPTPANAASPPGPAPIASTAPAERILRLEN